MTAEVLDVQPTGSGGSTVRASSKATTVPPWRPAHLIFGLAHFVAAGCLWLVVEQFFVEVATTSFIESREPLPEGAATSETTIAFGFWVFLYLLVAGAIISAYGVRRLFVAEPRPSHLDELHPARFFVGTWKAMDAEAEQERGQGGYDYGPLVALCVGAVLLTLMEYFGGSRTFDDAALWLEEQGVTWAWLTEARFGPFLRLSQFGWWSGWRVAGYFLIPALLIRLSRRRVRDHGLGTKGFREHAWIYGFGYYLVFIIVVIVSYTGEFSSYYPFYKLASRSGFDFVTWELMYAAQFFALEFFFRGWWLKSLKPMMGSHAIFAMVVPYCMIHYGKPFPETIGAIVAGLFLGTLAMKTRSIWSGFLIHVSVAISMDTAALLQTAGLPTQWWPAL